MLDEIQGPATRIRKHEDIIFHHKGHRERRENLKIDFCEHADPCGLAIIGKIHNQICEPKH
jgi:hypothetical protein